MMMERMWMMMTLLNEMMMKEEMHMEHNHDISAVSPSPPVASMSRIFPICTLPPLHIVHDPPMRRYTLLPLSA